MSYSRSPRALRWTTDGTRGIRGSCQIASLGLLGSLERVSPALSIRGLTKRYDDGFLAIDGFDIEIEAGRFFGLLGPNGAGKTTIISAVCNLIRITAGEI